jgi:hypothetical protein
MEVTTQTSNTTSVGQPTREGEGGHWPNGWLRAIGIATLLGVVGLLVWYSRTEKVTPAATPNIVDAYQFTEVDGYIVYSERSLEKLRQKPLEDPATYATAAAGDCGGNGDYWDMVKNMAQALAALRIALLAEHGNAIPPEDYRAAARKLFCDLQCDKKIAANDSDIVNGKLKPTAKKWASRGLTWKQALWEMLTTTQTGCWGVDNPELRDIPLDCK